MKKKKKLGKDGDGESRSRGRQHSNHGGEEEREKSWNTIVLLTYGGVCSFPGNRSSVFHLRAFQQYRPICISLLCTA